MNEGNKTEERRQNKTKLQPSPKQQARRRFKKHFINSNEKPGIDNNDDATDATSPIQVLTHSEKQPRLPTSISKLSTVKKANKRKRIFTPKRYSNRLFYNANNQTNTRVTRSKQKPGMHK